MPFCDPVNEYYTGKQRLSGESSGDVCHVKRSMIDIQTMIFRRNITVPKRKPSEVKPWLSLWGDNLPEEAATECTVYNYIYERNKDYPEDIALRYFDKTISYKELFQNIQQTARAFQALGVKKGDIVTICSVMTPETVYMFYALDLLGATSNMIDPRTSAYGIHEYIEEVDSKIVCTLNVAYPKVKEAVTGLPVAHVVVTTPADSLPAIKKFLYKISKKDTNAYDANVLMFDAFFEKGVHGEDFPSNDYDPEHVAVIVHTGGTTGIPKGVMLGDKAYNAVAIQTAVKRFKRKQRMLNIMPPFIAYGYANGVHLPLGEGAEIILIPQFDPRKFGHLLNKYHPEHTAGVPLHYQMLVNDPQIQHADLSYLISTGCGGDAISLGAEDEVNDFLLNHNSSYKLCKGYGMTEVASTATASIRDVNKRGSVGIPLYMTSIGIFKPNTEEELDYNTEGEICITGPNVMIGYYGMPEETAKIKKRHQDGQDWIHTGDIGWMDEEGYIYITNRIKRLIIRHDGFKVFPSVIENIISQHPDIETACAVSRKDPDHRQGDLPFVYLQLKGKSTKSREQILAEIEKICRHDLAEYSMPMGYELIDSMPYTSIGKVDFRYLEMMSKT